MIGSLNHTCKEITIVGGGITGLLAAYSLLKKDFKVTLYESNIRAGGLISTTHDHNGFIEHAAHSFRSGQSIVDLCQELELPIRTAKTKKKFILRDNKMRRMPLRTHEIISTFWRAATKKSDGTTQTMNQWAKHHLGQPALDQLITPLLNGIYASNSNEVYQDMVFPALTVPKGKTLLQAMWIRKKSNPKAKRLKMMAPEKGMGAFVDALASAISDHPNGTLHTHYSINEIPCTGNVMLATNAWDAGSLLEKVAPRSSVALQQVRYTSLITCTVFLLRNSFFPKVSIGILSGAHEKINALGILFNDQALPHRIQNDTVASFTFMFGGTDKPDINTLTDELINAMIYDDAQTLFGDKIIIDSIHITRWPHALPVYDEKLRNAWTTTKEDWCSVPGHLLFGNYTGQISLRGLCDSALQLIKE